MQLGLFLDLDGTARESTEKFIQTPTGQRIMAGVHEAMPTAASYAHHKAQGYTVIGVTNQGGCDTINRDTEKPLKSLEDAITEQYYTLELIPQLEAIYFCPDMKGLICYHVTARQEVIKIIEIEEIKDMNYLFRKPGAGMIYRAASDFEIDLTKSWMIGDCSEDEKAAIAVVHTKTLHSNLNQASIFLKNIYFILRKYFRLHLLQVAQHDFDILSIKLIVLS